MFKLKKKLLKMIQFVYFLSIFFITINGLSASLEESAELPDFEYNFLLDDQVDNFISRSKWGAKPPLRVRKLYSPTNLIILAHTVTPFCTTLETCSRQIVAIQKHHLGIKLDDISYNFLIGGDGNVYEGRGWDVINAQKNQSISVSFIGNFLEDHLSAKMIDALQNLLSEGVELGKLNYDYSIVCHNQTVATLSPGKNVYNVVKTWKHFQPGKLF